MRRILICIKITTVIIIHQGEGFKAKNKLHQRQVAVKICDAASFLDWSAPFAYMGGYLKFGVRKAPTLVDAFIKFALF